jgi:hypothetical protein
MPAQRPSNHNSSLSRPTLHFCLRFYLTAFAHNRLGNRDTLKTIIVLGSVQHEIGSGKYEFNTDEK